MTWLEEARATISQVHAALPADADLADRKKALREACPHRFRVTSWGRKVWPKACKEYLRRFDKSDTSAPYSTAKALEKHLSPLERMMRRAQQ